MDKTVEDWIASARTYAPALPPEELLQSIAYAPGKDAQGEAIDSHETFRAKVCQALIQDRRPADHAVAVYLLEQEIICHKAFEGYSMTLGFCAYLLFQFGRVEDSLLLWRAKATNNDTTCGLDVQLLVGGGLDETLQHLHSHSHPDAAEAAGYIEECRVAGDFNHNYHEKLAKCYA